jgi:hypothetical protein
VKPNSTGTGFKDESLKKRAKTQVCVLGASNEALARFHAAMNPQVDEATHTYFETTIAKEFARKCQENDDEDNDDESTVVDGDD